jgi:dolichyl-phosphate mannosyltransferase polypeptide 3
MNQPKKFRTIVMIVCSSIMAYLMAQRSLKLNESNAKQILNVFPFYILITFGCYCLGKIGYDLLVFNDYSNKTKELEQVYSIISSDIELFFIGTYVNR